jgi:hypothetical protein
MQFDSVQLRAAHQLGEAILQILLTIDSGHARRTNPVPKSMLDELGDNRLLRVAEAAKILSLS